MFSSDDDETLAAIASKAKRERRCIKEKRHVKSKRERKFESESDSQSVSDDDKKIRRTQKKRKKALNDESDNDEVTLVTGKDDTEGRKCGEISMDDDVPRTRGLSDIECHGHSSSSPDSGRDEAGNDLSNPSSHRFGENHVSDVHSGQVEEEGVKIRGGFHTKRGDCSTPLLDNSGKNDAVDEIKTDRFERTPPESSEEGSSTKKSIDRKKKSKQKEQPQDGASIRLTKLKKMVTLAGLRIVYKKFFEGVADNDRSRVKALEKEMERRGLTPPFTMEACRAFKIQKEQEAELAELSKNYIIEIGEDQKGRVTRQRSAALAFKRRGRLIFEKSSDEDEEDVEEREHMKQETQNMFKNLRGIVSDDADSS